MVTSRSLFNRLFASSFRLLTTMNDTDTATRATTESSIAANMPPNFTAIFMRIADRSFGHGGPADTPNTMLMRPGTRNLTGVNRDLTPDGQLPQALIAPGGKLWQFTHDRGRSRL